MSYQTRVIIFLSTMLGTAVVLLAIFLHVTIKELASLGASSVPLPTLDEKDKQELHNLLQQPAANSQAQVLQQNVGQAPDASTNNSQNSIQEIPAKALQ